MKITAGIEQTQEAIDEKIADLVQQIRENHNAIEEHEASIEKAKEALTPLLTQRGANWADETGYARLVGEGTRIFYDSAALDDLIIHLPLQYGWLKDYRTEVKVSGRVQVK
jgi:hypothetical protein